MTQGRDEGASLAIENRRPALALAAVQDHFSKHPELRQRYGERGTAKCVQDAEFHLAYLAQAIGTSTPALFSNYVEWAASMLSARNIPPRDLADSLAAIRAAIIGQLPAESGQIAVEYIDFAISRTHESEPPPVFLGGQDALAQLAREYLNCLLRGNRRDAGALISAAVSNGTRVADIYLRVFQPVMHEVGRLWQANEISVAQEHYCSAATQLVMSQLYELIFNAERRGKTLVAACTSGDLHEIGLRTVADFFEMAGWDTHYLGANVPIPDLLRLLIERRADVLALSATIAAHIGKVRETIRSVRSSPECQGVRILTDGYPFNISDDLWRKVGADGCARDALAAISLAEDLLKDDTN